VTLLQTGEGPPGQLSSTEGMEGEGRKTGKGREEDGGKGGRKGGYRKRRD